MATQLYGTNKLFMSTAEGYCTGLVEIEPAMQIRKLILRMLQSDNLSTKQNLRLYKHITTLAKPHTITIHAKVNNYSMDVIAKNNNYTIIIRSPAFMLYDDNGKIIKHNM
ncbi:hypothetical protein F-VV10_0436 [Faustovirus]|nr:hypothetical protein F-VV10_0436 [Faustovirus]